VFAPRIGSRIPERCRRPCRNVNENEWTPLRRGMADVQLRNVYAPPERDILAESSPGGDVELAGLVGSVKGLTGKRKKVRAGQE
jgi:hypothetical protein